MLVVATQTEEEGATTIEEVTEEEALTLTRLVAEGFINSSLVQNRTPDQHVRSVPVMDTLRPDATTVLIRTTRQHKQFTMLLPQ